MKNLKYTSPNTHYNNVLSSIPNIVSKNPRILDLALLGSHDSFSHKINKQSKVVEKVPLIAQIIGGKLFKNFSVRYAKAQVVGAYTQLMAGVRFFDVRLHYENSTFMTKHFFASSYFSLIIKDILKFLDGNKGEVIVFRFYNKSYRDKGQPYLIDFLKTVSYKDKTLLDYLHYKTRDTGHFDTAGITTVPYTAEKINLLSDYDKTKGIYLTDLTYNDVTKNGTESGIVMYGWQRNKKIIPPCFYADGSEKAKWLHTSIPDEAFAMLDEEVNTINKHYDNITRHLFRVNQANLTLSVNSIKQIYYSLKNYSLISMADKFNPLLISHNNFDHYLTAMPCVWVDYATCNTDDFNNKINQKLISFNTKLCRK